MGERKGRERGGEGRSRGNGVGVEGKEERKGRGEEGERKMEGEECEWIHPWLPVRPFSIANRKKKKVPVYRWVSSLSDRVLT